MVGIILTFSAKKTTQMVGRRRREAGEGDREREREEGRGGER